MQMCTIYINGIWDDFVPNSDIKIDYNNPALRFIEIC